MEIPDKIETAGAAVSAEPDSLFVIGKKREVFLFGCLLAVFLLRICLTYPVFNDTIDEQTHISAGLHYIETGRYEFGVEHPPLARLLIAALPYFAAGQRAEKFALWDDGSWAVHDEHYYWKTLTLARAGNLVFAALTFLIVWRWSLLLHGQIAAFPACLLVVCCPNLIAHASLATVDFPMAATVLAAAFFFWQWCEHPGWRYCLASAVAFSVAVLCKFSAPAFLPPIAAAYFLTSRWGRWRNGWPAPGDLRTGFARAAAFCAVAGLVIWMVYRFDFGPIVPSGHHHVSLFKAGQENSVLGLLTKQIEHRPLPAPRFWQGLIDVLSHNEQGHPAYLLGDVSLQGWWYYFPVAVAVKTTIPFLLLFGASLWLLTKHPPERLRASLYPLLAIALIFTAGVLSNLNIGIRHILAIYPLLAITASGVFAAVFGKNSIYARQAPGERVRRRQMMRDDSRRSRFRVKSLVPVLLAGLLGWHVVESVAAHPDYLAYFNEFAGDAEHPVLADSNLDWGQDLARLSKYVAENHIVNLQLNYFGAANPEKLGLRARVLGPEGAQAGLVAISVNRLMGIDSDPALFQWLRDRKPAGRVGKSIFLYYLPKPVHVVIKQPGARS